MLRNDRKCKYVLTCFLRIVQHIKDEWFVSIFIFKFCWLLTIPWHIYRPVMWSKMAVKISQNFWSPEKMMFPQKKSCMELSIAAGNFVNSTGLADGLALFAGPILDLHSANERLAGCKPTLCLVLEHPQEKWLPNLALLYIYIYILIQGYIYIHIWISILCFRYVLPYCVSIQRFLPFEDNQT